MSHAPAESRPIPAAAGEDYASLASEIVDIFYKIYGTHPGFRVNHAKGIVADGSFVATPAAAALSRAALFDGSTIPFTVRFSNDGGFPAIPDPSIAIATILTPRGFSGKRRRREAQS